MIEKLLRDLAKDAEPVEYPSGYYSPDGECVFVYNEGGEYYRQRIDSLLTVFRAPDDKRIIGVQIKGVPPGEVLGVKVTPLSSEQGERVDAVYLLLRSLRQESCEEVGQEESRLHAYAEVLQSLGCHRIGVDLQGSGKG